MKHDALTYARKIAELSDIIEELVDKLDVSATDKAQAKADHAKEKGLVLLRIKNKVLTEWEGLDLTKLTAGEREIVSEAICWEQVLEKDATDNLYKALITKIDARKAQMNGYQSINKVLN